jgi:ArsR family transcriptional regulator, arsenate/arsenite/antimonite-responsive transcriptional repressor
MDMVLFAKALADENRQKIMNCLCCVWLNVDEVVEKMDGKVKQPTVSHHLKILLDANLVLSRKDGKHHYYTLNQEYLTVCCGSLVRNFAPDYSQQLITVDKIPVADSK